MFPQRQDQIGGWVGAPQVGEMTEGDVDLSGQGTAWGKNSQRGAVHHVLENWSYEQDTDFKEHLCSWLWQGRAVGLNNQMWFVRTITQISSGHHQKEIVTSEEVNGISVVWISTSEIGLQQV